MGSAASVSQVYSDALHWFKQYFDAESYVDDFNSMDKDHDGAVEYEELQRWLRNKATKDDRSWKIISTNTQIFKIAHTHASASLHRQDIEEATSKKIAAESATPEEAAEAAGAIDAPPDRVVDVDEFRAFLVHLFVLSILWVHFKCADEWVEGQDVGNETLTLDEFRLACRTFNTAQSQESLTNEQIEADFNLLDTNKNGNVDFVEVCDYVCKFIDPNFADMVLKLNNGKSSTRNSVDLGWLEGEAPGSERTRRKTRMTVKKPEEDMEEVDPEKRQEAIDVVAREVDKHKTIAEFEQIKHSTEMALGVI